MTTRRWTALCWTTLALALLAALPTAAAPAATPAGGISDPVEASYAAIFAPASAAGESAPAALFVYCCSGTYCCEAIPSAECDGTRFGSIFQCAMRCSLC